MLRAFIFSMNTPKICTIGVAKILCEEKKKKNHSQLIFQKCEIITDSDPVLRHQVSFILFFFYLLKHNFILSPSITCHFSKLWGVFYKLTCCSHMEINASLCWYNNIPTGEQQLNSLLSLLVVWLPVKLGSKRWNEFGNLNSRRDKRTHIMVQLVEKERENCLHKQER